MLWDMQNEVRDKIKEFVEEKYYAKLLKSIEKGNRGLEVDYEEINRYDPELADLVLDEPDKFFELFENVLVDHESKLKPRITNLPETNHVIIKDIRSKHLSKLLVTDGLVRQASDVRPVSAIIVFECPSCGMTIEVKQNTNTIKEPGRCTNCGRTGKFDTKSKKWLIPKG